MGFETSQMIDIEFLLPFNECVPDRTIFYICIGKTIIVLLIFAKPF